MGETNKKPSDEASRWLRVGILTLATLGPVINTIIENARKRAQKLQELQTLQTLQELKEHPYSQEVLKRGGQLIERGNQVSHALVGQGSKLSHAIVERGSDLAEQGGKLSQVIVERGSDLAGQGGKLSQAIVEHGSDLTRELSERSSKLSQDLAKRGEVITREAARRSEVITREAAKRGRQATQDLAKRTEQVTERMTEGVGERPWLFWLPFALGLAAAAITTYQLVRRKLLQREAEPIQITPDGHLNGTHPADSRVLGLVSNKRYYPAGTSLDQLRATESGTLDVIYFASEDEARAQGFTSAE